MIILNDAEDIIFFFFFFFKAERQSFGYRRDNDNIDTQCLRTRLVLARASLSLLKFESPSTKMGTREWRGIRVEKRMHCWCMHQIGWWQFNHRQELIPTSKKCAYCKESFRKRGCRVLTGYQFDDGWNFDGFWFNHLDIVSCDLSDWSTKHQDFVVNRECLPSTSSQD